MYIMNKSSFTMKMNGGGNIKKGIPPTATSFYGLSLKSTRAKAGMAEEEIKTVTITGSGTVDANGHPLIEPILHNVLILPSGSGIGDERDRITNLCGPSPLSSCPPVTVSGGNPPYGQIVTSPASYGRLGFNSLSQPYPSEYQYFYTYYPATPEHPSYNIHKSPNESIVSTERWQRKSRFIKSVTLDKLGLKGITNWNQLHTLTISYIVGNNHNGGNRPDVFAHNGGDWNQTGFITDGPKGDFRGPENLYIQFYDKNNNLVGNKVTLWRTKNQPTLDVIQQKINDNSINVWSLMETNLYEGNKFTTRVINLDEFGDISNASFFLIRQWASASYNDNYGIKFIKPVFIYPEEQYLY